MYIYIDFFPLNKLIVYCILIFWMVPNVDLLIWIQLLQDSGKLIMGHCWWELLDFRDMLYIYKKFIAFDRVVIKVEFSFSFLGLYKTTFTQFKYLIGRLSFLYCFWNSYLLILVLFSCLYIYYIIYVTSIYIKSMDRKRGSL